MSLLASCEQRAREAFDVARAPIRCRIPQRLPPQGRQRLPLSTLNTKIPINSETTKPKFEVVAVQHPRFMRPKSANRVKEDQTTWKTGHPNARPVRTDRERLTPITKRTSTIPKKLINDNTVSPNKIARATAPISPKSPAKLIHRIKNMSGLPDQETIKKREDLDMLSEITDATHGSTDLDERGFSESNTTQSDLTHLENNWQKKIIQFERMKNELGDQQKAIMELYVTLRKTQHKMTSAGQDVCLPLAEDLKIMNVANMAPYQLLQLCSGSLNLDDSQEHLLTIDDNKLYNMPSKLVATCEQTLVKRKEIIDWFELLKSREKGISVNMLSKKICEFNAENNILKSSLDQVKAEFFNELTEIVNILRKGVNETMNLRCRTKELTYKLSELSSQNTDLRKQIHRCDQSKSYTNNKKIQELEKELKEEKGKKAAIKERLFRAEGQVKINVEQSFQLQAALEQARSQTRTLERSVQQLHEQNCNLQTDFDKELNKLQESIRQNTLHLEEIADSREKLQSEKEDLEKQLAELSMSYNESLSNIKHELNNNVAKLIETEDKYGQQIEDRKKLESKVDNLCAQLLDSELHNKDLLKKIQEKESQLNKTVNTQIELEDTKRKLEIVNKEIDDYRNRLVKQEEAVKEIEQSFKETLNLDRNLKNDLSNKEVYIAELEKKTLLLEQQLQESGSRMESYKEQLSSLKSHITQLQEDFGEFENLTELHEMVNKQRAKLLEATRQSGELAEALQKKDEELERHIENLTELEHLLEQREGVVKLLSEKEEEQANIINILKNNLQMRAQADIDLNQQLAGKNAEIDSLITNVKTRKQQITQLEKIILTLEEQNRKSNLQRRKDQKKIADYEYHLQNKRNIEAPPENIDNLFRILEDELGTPFDQLSTIEQGYVNCNKKYVGDRTRDIPEKMEYQEENYNESLFQTDRETVPTKIVTGNFVKKTYLTKNEEQLKGDGLDRKKAIMNIDTQKWIHVPEPNVSVLRNASKVKDKIIPPLRGSTPVGLHKENLTRNEQYLSPNKLRDEKKCKMFKIAGHRL